MRRSNYDKFPFVDVPGADTACVAGWPDIGRRLLETVRRRASGGLGGDRAARTRLVLHHEGLARGDSQSVCDEARDEIDAASGRLRRDELDRPARIGVLGERGPGGRDDRDGRQEGEHAQSLHALAHRKLRTASIAPV